MATTRTGAHFAEPEPEAKPKVRKSPLDKLPSLLVNALCIWAASWLTFFAMEFPCNWHPYDIWYFHGLIGRIIIAAAMAAMYFLLQRRRLGPALIAVGCFVIGMFQHYTTMHRGTAITPVDIWAIPTAAAVAGTYNYTPDGWCIIGFCCLIAAIIVIWLMRKRKSRGNVLLNLGIGVVLIAGIAGFAIVPEYTEDFKVWLNQWHINECYEQQGFFPVFVAAAQDMVLEPPEGYDREASLEDEAKLAAEWEATEGSSERRKAAVEQFDELHPNVVIIMDETFSDLSIFEGIYGDYEGTTYVRDELASECFMYGDLAVSVHGGGTCNSEFELLTSLPQAFLGTRKYPYVQYNFSTTPNLARQFNALGYTTTAMHPNLANNWSRAKVYEQMGFDRFLSIDDFEGAEVFHNGVTDLATYDTILDILKSGDEAQFVFDVTMANHSAYDTGNIPDSEMPDGSYGYEATSDLEINEFIACMNRSEADLRAFIDELRELDEPTVVLFFGDHQPYFTDDVYAEAISSDETPENMERSYQTLYAMWANYDIAGAEELPKDKTTTICYLASYLLNAIGAPMTDYQEALLTLEKDMPAINCFGVMDAEGTWHWLDDWEGVPEETTTARERLRQISYVYYEGMKN